MNTVRLSIRQRFTLVIVLCVLLPLLGFCVWLMNGWRAEQIQDRTAALEEQSEQVWNQASRTVELCSLFSRTFLSNGHMSEYLTALHNGETLSNQALYEFAVREVASMERMVVSNPYLYCARVYSTQYSIQEIMPIFFGRERLEEIGWEGTMPTDGSCWLLNYTDKMFSANVSGLMALLTPITTDDGELLGLLEVSVPMESAFPALFRSEEPSCLVTSDGQVYGLSQEESLPARLKEVPAVEGNFTVWETELDGQPVLASAVSVPALDGIYYTVSPLADLHSQFLRGQLLLTLLVIAGAFVIWLLARVLVGRMLRQLYHVLDGVRAFSQGETEVEIPVESKDEIGEFSSQINLLLGSIRDLIQRQIQSQVLIKNTQIRALQNQINAHFIHNVLESIKMMAQIEEKYEIAQAITDLSKLLRYTMNWKRPVVRLEEELQYIQHYLALVNLRYDGQVTLDAQVPQSLLDQAVPKVSLQPIVENAVVHGPPLREDRTIFLTVREENGVTITIRGDTCLSEEDRSRMLRSISGTLEGGSSSGNGIGLHNIQKRIQSTFGAEYGLQVGDGVTVTLPRREAEGGERL